MAKLYLPCLIVYKGHFIYKAYLKLLLKVHKNQLEDNVQGYLVKYTSIV